MGGKKTHGNKMRKLLRITRMENGIDAVGDLTTYAVPCCPECKNETYSQKHCPFCGENLMEVANEN